MRVCHGVETAPRQVSFGLTKSPYEAYDALS